LIDGLSSKVIFTPTEVQIGTITGARLGIKGSGTTSATTSLLVQNSAGTNLFNVRDDGNIGIFTGRIFDGSNTDKSFYIVGNTNVVSNFQSVSLRVYDGTAYASGLEVVGNNASPKVGIGTTTPASQLEIKGNSDASFQISGGTAGRRALFSYFNSPSVFEFDVSNILRIKNGSTYSLYTDTTGSVGIGTLSPSARTHIVGAGTTGATTSLLVQNSAGVASLQVLDDTSVFNNGKGAVGSNTAFGGGALINNTTGSFNNAIGFQALINNATGSFNTANGGGALRNNNTGADNVAIGVNALFFNTTGSSSTAIGKSALFNNTASNNTAVGFEAALTNTTGTSITAIGYQALRLSTGGENTAVGANALAANTTGSSNTANGYFALQANTTGILNTAIGASALRFNNTGGDNTAIGANALGSNTSGNNNTANGYFALQSNGTGSNNTALGRSALRFNTVSNNTAVGYEAVFTNTSGTGVTAIGYQALRLSTGNDNTAVGYQAGLNITTGTQNTALGSGALAGAAGARNTGLGYAALTSNTGAFNTAVGRQALSNNTTAGSNTAIGENCQSGNFSGSVILGKDAIATAANQFVVGSTGTNAGAVTTEVIVPDTTWTVRINGANYKIAMLAI
jgi:hypothetical protein